MKKFYYLIAMALTALTFTSCEDVPAPYGDPTNPNATTVVEPAGDGTSEAPFNIAGAIAKCKEIGGTVSSEKYYVKGYAATAATADGQYGNVSFDMTDSKDGKGKKFKAYQVAGSDGQKLAEGYTINVGDEVVIYGPMYNYNNTTPETAGKAVAYIVTVNGEKTNGGGGESGETIGSKDAPISVAEAITMINALENGGKTANKAYVKGKVVKVTTNQANFEKYGNLNYYISEDGKDNNTIQVYSGDGLNGEKFKSVSDIAAGDEVIVFGTLYKYVNANTGAVVPEIDKGNYLVSLVKGSGGGGESSGDAKGSGTQADPYNAAAANAYVRTLAADTESANDVYIKGKIVKYAKNGEFGTQYGNGSFYISDDGSESSEQFYVFRTLFLNNEKFKDGDTAPNVGDEVVICGKVVYYQGKTPETAANKSYIVSINSSGGGGEPGPSGETLGTKDAPLNIAQALELINALADKAESEQYAYVKGKVVKVTTNQANFEKYGNLNYLISEDGTENNTITVYSGDGLNGAKFTGITDLSAGDEVIVYGKLYKYVNSSGKVTPEINSGNYLVSLVKAGGGGGGGGGTANTGTLANPLTASQIYDAVAAMEKGVTSAEDYYVKGKICSIKYEYSVDYGTATFNISDDGATGGKEFIAYSTYYHASEQKWVEGDTQVAVGDEVVVCGKVVNYNGNTPEFASKKSYVVTINGK